MKAFNDFRHTEQNAVVFYGGEDRFFALMKYITENKIPVQRIEKSEPTLEALFLEVTK